MKSTGIVRKVDQLGRIVIPKELRKKYGLDVGVELSFEDSGDGVLVKVSGTSCKLCGKNIDENCEIPLCPKCIKRIKNS